MDNSKPMDKGGPPSPTTDYDPETGEVEDAILAAPAILMTQATVARLQANTVQTGTSNGYPFRMGSQVMSAIALAQSKVQTVSFDATNTFHNYKYATGAAIVEAGRKALGQCGLALVRLGWQILPPDRECERHPAQNIPYGRLVACYQLVHVSGESMPATTTTLDIYPEKGRPPDKATGAALTQIQKYAVAGTLNLGWRNDDEEVDARHDGTNQPQQGRRDQGRREPPPRTTQRRPASEGPKAAQQAVNPKYAERATLAREALRKTGMPYNDAIRAATGLTNPPAKDALVASQFAAIADFAVVYLATLNDPDASVTTHAQFLADAEFSKKTLFWADGAPTEAGIALDKTTPKTLGEAVKPATG